MSSVSSDGESYFDHWDTKSWVRAKPFRTSPIAGLPFSPDLVPLASHPVIAADPEKRLALLGYRLFAHLKFTTKLELDPVNPICAALGQARVHTGLTTRQRRDALRICCDEAGHALFVELFADRVAETF